MILSADEVQAAVERLVRTTIRQPYGAIGNRQLELPFADYQNAAASVFLQPLQGPVLTPVRGRTGGVKLNRSRQ